MDDSSHPFLDDVKYLILDDCRHSVKEGAEKYEIEGGTPYCIPQKMFGKISSLKVWYIYDSSFCQHHLRTLYVL